jgi:ribosomal protein S18 acetylase RimI-like enzyme
MTIVRDALPEDAFSLGKLHVRTWREAYWGVLPDQAVMRESVEGRTRFWRHHLGRIRTSPDLRDENVTLAQASNGAAVGFVWTGAARSSQVDWDGEIYMLYVLHAMQRRGVGRRLLASAAASLVRRGFFRLGLWVLEDNGPARAFYETLGGHITGARRQQGSSGAEIVVGYLWEDSSVLLGDAPATR